MADVSDIKFGTDGWRARIGEDYTYENVRRAGEIARLLFQQRSVVLCALVSPWNVPFMTATWKVAPCITCCSSRATSGGGSTCSPWRAASSEVKATVSMKFTGVIPGSAFKKKGVQRLLDCVVNYLPSPIDVPPMQGQDSDGKPVEGMKLHVERDGDGPLCGQSNSDGEGEKITSDQVQQLKDKLRLVINGYTRGALIRPEDVETVDFRPNSGEDPLPDVDPVSTADASVATVEGRPGVPKPHPSTARQELYGRMDKHHLAPLWEVLHALVPREPLKGGALTGRKVLVTAGPTREALDPVRYISNQPQMNEQSIFGELSGKVASSICRARAMASRVANAAASSACAATVHRGRPMCCTGSSTSRRRRSSPKPGACCRPWLTRI